MNKKGQSQIGVFIILFIVLLVGLILLQSSAQNVGLSTTAIALGGTNSNNTLLAADIPAVGSSVDLVGQDLLSTPVVVNGTTGQSVDAGNYTISEIVSTSTGVKTISFQLDDPQFSSTNQTATGSIGLNITYQYGPEGYINNSGGRALSTLIILMFAIALVILSIIPVVREKFLQK